MFFDVLELWEASWNDPGSIWEKSFLTEIFSKIDPKGQPYELEISGPFHPFAMILGSKSFQSYKESTTKLDLFFEHIAPAKFKEQCQKF